MTVVYCTLKPDKVKILMIDLVYQKFGRSSKVELATDEITSGGSNPGLGYGSLILKMIPWRQDIGGCPTLGS